jgi:hypothetical protein
MQAENSIINQLEIHKCPNQLFDRYRTVGAFGAANAPQPVEPMSVGVDIPTPTSEIG